ncbi:MAG: hypothetical protein IJ682_13960 [Lachnospiraceae bacterium]|nr:hypothetical protein [Lachnospiraceae bacterium]
MNMPKKIAAALCATLALSAAVSAAPMEAEAQVDILTKTAMVHDGWFVLPEREKNADEWRYAITDLDRNGRLEVLKVRRGWAEGGPKLLCEELSEDGSRPHGEIALSSARVPDILSTDDATGQPIATLYDAKNNLFHYIFREIEYHGEYESVTTKYALTFSNGVLRVSPLAHFHWTLSGYDGSVNKKYYLPAQGGGLGAEIDAAHYENIERTAFPGCEARNVAFSWKSAEDLKNAASGGRLKEALAASFAQFAS